MIVNKPRKGDILIYNDDYNQRAIAPETLRIKDRELYKIISELEEKNKEKDKQILDLQKKNKMIFEILLVLIQQANINLDQQQLLLLKNKEEK